MASDSLEEPKVFVHVGFGGQCLIFSCVPSDYIIVGSDSGRIVILEYNPIKNVFEKIHQETYGKSGCRRIVPGQYLAIDPKGRAVMIGKHEQQTDQFSFK